MILLSLLSQPPFPFPCVPPRLHRSLLPTPLYFSSFSFILYLPPWSSTTIAPLVLPRLSLPPHPLLTTLLDRTTSKVTLARPPRPTSLLLVILLSCLSLLAVIPFFIFYLLLPQVLLFCASLLILLPAALFCVSTRLSRCLPPYCYLVYVINSMAAPSNVELNGSNLNITVDSGEQGYLKHIL